MDHAEARERLELAAAEPGGFDRLMAGDTIDAAALAGHLAGCDECAAEMLRLRRASEVIRQVVRSTPPPDLRDRTLALVAAVGRDRPGADRPDAGDVPPAPVPAVPTRRRLDRSMAGLAALAAVLVAVIAGAAFSVVSQRDAELARRTQAIGALERIASAGFRVSAEPDAHHVALASTDGSEASGRLVFSPRTRELVVVASGLAEPPAGREFRCWLEVDGERHRVGRMFFADDLAFWVGPVEDVADLPPETFFGVTMVDAGGDSLDGPPTLSGAL